MSKTTKGALTNGNVDETTRQDSNRQTERQIRRRARREPLTDASLQRGEAHPLNETPHGDVLALLTELIPAAR
jgi:hypothetical protein